MKQTALVPKFVEFMPEQLEEGVLYVSMEHATVIHRCCCGCKNEVVTPLSPTDWQLTFDGDSISLYPSIGNWGFECQSHYWINRNTVRWSGQWTSQEIEAGRAADMRAKKKRFGVAGSPDLPKRFPETDVAPDASRGDGFLRSLWKRLWPWEDD